MDYIIKQIETMKRLDEMYKDVSRIENVLFNNFTVVLYLVMHMPSIDNIDTDIENVYASRISIPVLYEEVHEKFIRFVTSNDKFFVLSNGSLYCKELIMAKNINKDE